MARFRNKATIEAVQINNNAEEVQAFIGDKGTAIDTDHGTLVTLDCIGGLMSAGNNAYITKDPISGQYFIQSKDTFEENYEKVD